MSMEPVSSLCYLLDAAVIVAMIKCIRRNDFRLEGLILVYS